MTDLPLLSSPDPARLSRHRGRFLLALLAASLALFFGRWGAAWHSDPRRHHGAREVTVYGTAWCPACDQLRLCLRRGGVPFEERDVERSKRAASEWWALGGSSVPLTLAGQEVAHGLRRGELEPALRSAGYAVDCWSDPARPAVTQRPR